MLLDPAAVPLQEGQCLRALPGCGKLLVGALNAFLLEVSPCSLLGDPLRENSVFNLLPQYTQPPPLPPSSLENRPGAGSGDSCMSSSQRAGNSLNAPLQDLSQGILNLLHSSVFSPEKVLHDPR